MNKTITQFRWLVTMILLVTAMAMPKMAWAEITPTKPSSGDGTSGNPYQIGTAAELYWFAALVNGDTNAPGVSSANTGACATLTADITVNMGVLKSDGTLADNVSGFTTWTPIGNYQSPYTGTFDGQGHAISGLYFNDSKKNYVGLFGYNKGTIKNVGVVDSYFCGKEPVGGVCGYNYGGTITGCYNTGTVSGTPYNVGGVCGYNYGGTITGCYNTGTVSGSNDVGGVCGYNYGGTITGCYNTGSVSGSGNYVGGVCGEIYKGTITGCYTNNGEVYGSNKGTVTDCDVKSDDDFKDGTVCSPLNTALKNANASVRFYQGTNYPKLISHIEGVYQISNKGELYAFALLVNNGETSANAVLTKDITVNTGVLKEDGTLADGVSGFTTWTPIGNNQNQYTGTFDGQGHTISGLYFNDRNKSYVGLFGYNKNKGTIKNVGVVDSYFCGNYLVGGVCGSNYGGTITGCYNTGTVSSKSLYVGGVCGRNYIGTITGCYNTGTVSSSSSGSESYVGGVCGQNSSGTITGCYNTGTVSSSGSKSYVGGVCGSNDFSKITGCYNTGTVSSSGSESYVGGVCGQNSSGTITGCCTNNGGVYGYNDKTVTDCYEKENNDFTNGTVCSLLNDALKKANASVRFYQGVSYPELMTFPALVEGVYQISNKEELYAFALLVNNGETSANAVLTADITVNTGVLKENGNLADDVSGFITWTPIGNEQNPYTGTFDGQEHTISGLYFNDSNNSHVGLFGYNKGTIKNVGIVDSYFCGKERVGGVCGRNYNGTITGCYNTGTVSSSGNYVGGVCGQDGSGTITGCYNTGTVSSSGSDSYVGGVCGNQNNGTITGCYNTGTVSGSSSRVGGVCGVNSYGTITGCYNTGTVSSSGSESYVGGVCGYNYGKIINCYSTGEVSGSSSRVGGVCGYNSSKTINCYFNSSEGDINAIGTNNNGTVTNVEGKTTAQFKSGEVCYLLSQGSTVTDGENTTYYSGSVWGQQLGTDDYPVLSDYKVIKAAKGDKDANNNDTYWATFSNLDNDVTLSVPENRTLDVYNATVSNGTMTLTERTDSQVAKGEGVLLKADGEYVNAKANETNGLTGETYANNNLVATPATEKTITADTGYKLYRLTYNKVSAKTGLGFYLGLVKNADGSVASSNGSQLKATPGKAYLKVSTEAATTPATAAVARSFVFPGDDETTSIGEIVIEGDAGISGSANADGRIYNLQGQQVTAPMKGLYIKNNRKVFIK